MAVSKDIQTRIQELEVLRTVTRAYAEIASVRMIKIRGFVLKNREFLGSIDSIFRTVISSYQKEVRELIKKSKDGENITFLAHNGKTVSVFLSANTGLYGDIVKKTFDSFIKDVGSTDVEVAIVGKLGSLLYEQTKPGSPYSYFDFPDYKVDNEALGEIIRHIVQYEEIRVYYGKFQSVVRQDPTVYKINAVSTSDLESKSEEVKYEKYIFEPTLEEILQFFETEIFASLFDQTMRESQLAKFASRIGAMSRATENINETLELAKIDKLKMMHERQNKKQLNSLAGLMFK